jgi:hypothetical protein
VSGIISSGSGPYHRSMERGPYPVLYCFVVTNIKPMATPLTPDEAKSWFSVLYSATEKSTPVTMLFLLVAGGIFGWHLLKQIDHSRTTLVDLHHQLIAAKDGQLALSQDFTRQIRDILEKCAWKE